MAETKNLCAQIPIVLHERVSGERERLDQTTSEYIANLILENYNMIENQNGGITTIVSIIQKQSLLQILHRYPTDCEHPADVPTNHEPCTI